MSSFSLNAEQNNRNDINTNANRNKENQTLLSFFPSFQYYTSCTTYERWPVWYEEDEFKGALMNWWEIIEEALIDDRFNGDISFFPIKEATDDNRRRGSGGEKITSLLTKTSGKAGLSL